jgi:hypothetical protein
MNEHQSPNPDSEPTFTAPEQAESLSDEHEANIEKAKPEYQILRSLGHGESDAEFRARYIEYTDRLIYELQEKQPDYVVYLDKSGRPVQWLVDELWEFYAGDIPKPQSKFINVDREQWDTILGDYQTEALDFGKLAPEDIQQLRDVFADPNDTSRSLFDGKKVMVIDEVKVSGATLATARGLMERAFPDAEIGASWWMTPMVKNNTTEVPVWYKSEDPTGRGIDNRNQARSEASTSSRQREGWQFLSTRFDAPDPDSEQLRAEIKALADQVQSGEQPIKPSYVRDDDKMSEAELAVLRRQMPGIY